HETVVSFVLVEAIDDVVTVPPGIAKIDVGFVTATVGIARHVQPMPRPANPVLFRSEQLVDQFFISLGRLVGHKALHPFGTGWKPGEIKACPADERALVRGRRGGNASSAEFCSNEIVDRILYPVVVFDSRRTG